MMRATVFLSLLTTTIVPTLASAQGRPSVAVAPFSGPTAADVRAAVVRILSERSEIEVISSRAILDAARGAGQDGSSVEGFEAAADRLRVNAIIRGEILRDKGRWGARLEAYHRATGRVAEKLSVNVASIQALDDAVGRRLWSALGPSLRSAPKPNRSRSILVTSTAGPTSGVRQVDDAFRRATWLQVLAPEDLGSPVPKDPGALARLAKRKKLDGFVTLDLNRRRRRWYASVVLTAPDGTTQETIERDSARSRQLAEDLLGPLSEALDRLEPAPPPPPPKAKRVQPSARRDRVAAGAAPSAPSGGVSIPAADPSEGAAAALELAASFRLFGRNLSYNDDVLGGLRPYDLGGTPFVRIEGTWYPATHFIDGPLTWIGVEAMVDLGLGINSSDQAGRDFGTSAFAVQGALRGRLPLDVHEVGLSLGLGLDSFTIDDASDGTGPDVPDAEYSFVRVGVDGRVRIIEGLNLRPSLGFRQVFSPGEVTDDEWFPNASLAGIDARLRVGYAVIDNLEVQAGFELVRYFASFDPEPGDFPVAGGAIDQRWSAALGVAYRL